MFDVGGLLLTTADPGDGWTNSAGAFSASMRAPNSSSKIQIASGAQLNALQQNSYVALVAPRIEQGGKVRVNGSAAYVAGDSVSLLDNRTSVT